MRKQLREGSLLACDAHIGSGKIGQTICKQRLMRISHAGVVTALTSHSLQSDILPALTRCNPSALCLLWTGTFNEIFLYLTSLEIQDGCLKLNQFCTQSLWDYLAK